MTQIPGICGRRRARSINTRLLRDELKLYERLSRTTLRAVEAV
jgi:hypothetical protein